MEAYLLNPPRRRKASRRRGRARNDWWGHISEHSGAAVKGWRKKSRKGGSRPKASSRIGIKKGARKFRSRAKKARKSRRGNPVYRLRSGRFTGRRTGRRVRRGNPGRRYSRRSRRRYGRNPGGALGMLAVPRMIDVRIPFVGSGILQTVGQAVLQGTVVGLIGIAGMWGSGKLVDLVLPAANAAASPNTFVRNWGRPLLFTAAAAVTGGLAAVVAPRGKKAQWALVGASGPAIRAGLGILANLIPATSTGLVAEVRNFAGGLADYLQMGENEEVMGAEEDGVSDYLQMGEDADDAMGALYEAGMEDIYEAGMGAEEEEDVFV